MADRRRIGDDPKANLSTGVVTNLTYPISAFEQGGYDLNIADNGLALFTAGSSIGETRPSAGQPPCAR